MAIGRVTVNGAMPEQGIVMLLWMTFGLAMPTGVRGRPDGLQPPPDQFSRAIDDLKLVARARLKGGLRKNFLAYLSEAKRMAEQRNRVAQGTWRAEPDQFGRHRCQGLRVLPLTGEPLVDYWKAADVGAIADQILDARALATQLWPRLETAIPELKRFVHQGPVPASLYEGRPGSLERPGRDGPGGGMDRHMRCSACDAPTARLETSAA
jgi:hypothetical protein